MTRYRYLLLTTFCLLFTKGILFGQNPFIKDQFTADPTARVFEGKIYVYASHDIPSPIESLKEWFCMADYHVFSSEDLIDWTDHGVILSQENTPWVKPDSYSMWAPDCVSRDGKYYFYYPAIQKDTTNNKRFSIGVAVSDRPDSGFVPKSTSIDGISGIDPCVFIDKDNQAYIYWSGAGMFVAKLKDNMTELASEPMRISGLPDGFKEGPFLFERNGIYYYTFPWVQDKTETLAYAIGTSPTGPFEFKGLIMEQWTSECWTNHHSIVEYKDQWYLFYHHNDYSPDFDKNRSARIDSLFFNADGTIQQVEPTFRGVGITQSSSNIPIDRYTEISKYGVSIKFLDDNDKFEGWKTIFESPGSWLQYNSVDFKDKPCETLKIRTLSSNRGILEVRADGLNGTVISKIEIPKTDTWTVVSSPILKNIKGIQNIFITLIKGKDIEIDWITFE